MIKIAVATNINFYQKSLSIVIPSLISCGVNPQDIHVFNAGFHEYKCVTDIIGVTHHQLDHNSFENSALIEICEKELYSEYWFLIHDTCRAGPQFKELLYNIPSNKPPKVALTIRPSMSMGSYRYDYLLSVKEKLYALKNKDYSHESMIKWKMWGVQGEDHILWQTDPPAVPYRNMNYYCCQVKDYNNWYDTGTTRRTEYYPSLDLYKNKGNWQIAHDKMNMSL